MKDKRTSRPRGSNLLALARIRSRVTSRTGRALALVVWLLPAFHPMISGAADGIHHGAPTLGLLQEFGMLQSGRFSAAGPFTREWVDHFGAFFGQEAVIGERLEIAVGLGGIFQFQKPEEVSAGWGGSQYRNFFIGPTQATLAYRIGDPERPWLKASLGIFPFKYNPDAANLGEYLFRSNPYPNYIMTGGYAVINNASAYLQGARAVMRTGRFTLDLLAITETTMPPLYDWSLAALAGYRSESGLLELGAGVNFKRLIPIRPSRTAPEQVRNAYFKKGDRWYSGNTSEYKGRMDFAAAHGRAEEAAAHKAVLDSVTYWTTTDSVADPVSGSRVPYRHPDYRYYSASGTVMMARISLDPKKFLPWDVLGPEDLKLYGEAALLGWKDYPVFYGRKADRLPLMAGFNLPAFRWLDLFAVQVEYYPSPYINSTERVATVGMPLPFVPRGNDPIYSENAFYDVTEKDNYSWSILMRKEILPGVTLYSQFARDHLRLVSLNTWFGPALETDENLGTEKDWYWMVQVGIGI